MRLRSCGSLFVRSSGIVLSDLTLNAIGSARVPRWPRSLFCRRSASPARVWSGPASGAENRAAVWKVERELESSGCHLERLVRLFARTCFLWTLLTEARLLPRFDAAFISAGGSSSGEAIPSAVSTASIFCGLPANLKKRNTIAFCASSPSRVA